MSYGGSDRRDACFTLIECLIALVVLAMGFAALHASYGGALRGVTQADRNAGAVLLARNVLASVGPDLPLTAGRRAGTGEGGFRWIVDVAPYAEDRAVAGRVPMLVTVTVLPESDAEPPLVTLTTVKLGRVVR